MTELAQHVTRMMRSYRRQQTSEDTLITTEYEAEVLDTIAADLAKLLEFSTEVMGWIVSDSAAAHNAVLRVLDRMDDDQIE